MIVHIPHTNHQQEQHNVLHVRRGLLQSRKQLILYPIAGAMLGSQDPTVGRAHRVLPDRTNQQLAVLFAILAQQEHKLATTINHIR